MKVIPETRNLYSFELKCERG